VGAFFLPYLADDDPGRRFFHMGFWTIAGGRERLCRVTSPPEIEGSGRSTVHPTFDDTSALTEKLNILPCGWTLLSNAAPTVNIDPAGEGFVDRIQARPDAIHVKLRYWGDEEEGGQTTAVIVVPQSDFDEIFDLFKLLLLNPGMSYRIQLEFTGLRSEDAELDYPTAAEFLAGKPYFSTDGEFEKAARFIFYAS
jgi:hypothetical protein